MYHIENGWFLQSHKIHSPNCNIRPENTQIDAIIIHSISMPLACYEGDDISLLFTNQLDCDKDLSYDEVRGLKVSAHLLIRRTGELIQYVDLNERAWHAGKSCLGDREKCNDFSIGMSDIVMLPRDGKQILERALTGMHFSHGCSDRNDKLKIRE